VDIAQLHLLEDHLHPLPLRQGQALLEALVIGLEAQDPGREGQVGAVPLARLGEGAVKAELHPLGDFPEEVPGDEGQAAGPRRVAGGGPHHDGADHVQ
jgi:hypothetical protein